jgi:hypothetical protein
MATMNFSVPSDVKEAFDKAFKGENKSAVLTGLMRQAVALEHSNAVLVTADERYYRKAAGLGRIVRLREFQLERA